MEGKKISFGFNKTTNKQSVINRKQPNAQESKIELIKCLEGQQIKLMEEMHTAAPLVIPMMENTKTSNAMLSLKKRRAVLLGEEEQEVDTAPAINLKPFLPNTIEDLEMRATRELLTELKSHKVDYESSMLVLPLVSADELPLDGAKQSTLDDYESIPVDQFGLAMLRGMGWVKPPKKKGDVTEEVPIVRPKGMGLGADKALKAKPLLVPPEANEVLEIKKQAFVRILGGKGKNMYGQIEGFDDHAGRVIVRMAIGGKKEAFNEFLCQPISKKEYAEYGKCINTDKYEMFKKMKKDNRQINIKNDGEKSSSEVVCIKYKSEFGSKYSERKRHSSQQHKSIHKLEIEKTENESINRPNESNTSNQAYVNYIGRRCDEDRIPQPKSNCGSRANDLKSTYEQKKRSHKSKRKSRKSKKSNSDSSISQNSISDEDSRYNYKKIIKSTK